MARGRLRIYLGAAPGVGKTVAMLDEGRRRSARGTDVVAGLVETHGRAHTAEMIDGPGGGTARTAGATGVRPSRRWTSTPCSRATPPWRSSTSSRTPTPRARATRSAGRTSTSCSMPASTSSRPSTSSTWSRSTTSSSRSPVSCSARRCPTRWCGAPTRSSSSTCRPRRCAAGWPTATSTRPRRSTPRWRTTSGSATSPRCASWPCSGSPTASRRASGATAPTTASTPPWPTRERVVVALSGGPEGETLLRRGARIASRGAGGELLAVHVARADGLSGPPLPTLATLRRLTEELGGSWHTVTGEDPAEAILDVARGVNASQVVIGSTRRPRWRTLAVPSTTEEVITHSGDIDVHVVTHSFAAGRGWRVPRAALPRRRVRLGYAAAVIGPLVLTGLLVAAARGPRPAPDRAALPARHGARRPARRHRTGPRRGRGVLGAAQLVLHPTRSAP